MRRYWKQALLFGGMMAAGLLPIAARQQAPVPRLRSPHAIVVHEALHVLSPRLRDTVPIPRPYIPQKQPIHQRTLPSGAPLLSSPVVRAAATAKQGAQAGSAPPDANFPGIGAGLGSYSDCCAPPDPNGSAGATQFVEWVNLDFAVFSKSTGSLTYGPVYADTLWSSLGGECGSNNDGDPIVKYDAQAQRWVMMQPVWVDPYALCVAVSTTSDATGSYYLYQVPVPGGYYPDYPKLSVWTDGYYVTYNAFQGSTFMGAYACALDRASMLTGGGASMQCFNSGYPNSDLLPSDLDGDNGAPGTTAAPPSGTPDYLLSIPTGSTSALDLWKFHVDWTNPANSALSGPVAIPVTAFSNAAWIPQEGTSQELASQSGHLMYRLAYRNFGAYDSLVVSQTVQTSSGNAGIRWYEIRDPGSNPTVYQQGTFAPDSNYRWMPSTAEDKAGDIAIGYSVSGTAMHPAIRYTGRTPADPQGTMESEQTIVNGSGSQLTGVANWGDYTSMSVDPADDCTFWYTNEYLPANGDYNWSTRIASFSFPNCTGQTATQPKPGHGGGKK